MSGDAQTFVRSHWPIIVALGAGLVAWGTNTAILRANEANDVKVEQRVARVESDISDIKQAITRIETNQGRDSQEAQRLRASLDALLQELRSRPPGPPQ